MDHSECYLSIFPGKVPPSCCLTMKVKVSLSKGRLHEATLHIQNTLASNLQSANAPGKHPPWRMKRKRFNQDMCYIRSGAVNLSPAWFTPGSNVGPSDASSNINNASHGQITVRSTRTLSDPHHSCISPPAVLFWTSVEMLGQLSQACC